MNPGEGLSVTKLKLLALLGKAQNVIRFATPNECDAAFLKIACFCKNATLAREAVLRSSEFAQQTLSSLVVAGKPPNPEGAQQKRRKQVCQCKPFAEACPVPVQRLDTASSGLGSALCDCCAESDGQDAAAGSCVTDYCAECLCSLSRLLFHSESDGKDLNTLWN